MQLSDKLLEVERNDASMRSQDNSSSVRAWPHEFQRFLDSPYE